MKSERGTIPGLPSSATPAAFTKAVAAKLERLTENTGKNRSQFGFSIGLPARTVPNVIDGKRPPSLYVAARLARALGVTLDWLTDDAAGWPPPQSEAEKSKTVRREFAGAPMLFAVTWYAKADNAEDRATRLEGDAPFPITHVEAADAEHAIEIVRSLCPGHEIVIREVTTYPAEHSITFVPRGGFHEPGAGDKGAV